MDINFYISRNVKNHVDGKTSTNSNIKSLVKSKTEFCRHCEVMPRNFKIFNARCDQLHEKREALEEEIKNQKSWYQKALPPLDRVEEKTPSFPLNKEKNKYGPLAKSIYLNLSKKK